MATSLDLLCSISTTYITASLKILAEIMESKNKVCRTALANLTASQCERPLMNASILPDFFVIKTC